MKFRHWLFSARIARSDIIPYFIIFLLGAFADSVWASDELRRLAENIKLTFSLLKEIMTSAAYASGIGFCMIGLLKFKAHKDNPAQIPLSTPIVLIAVSAGLLFLPTVFDIAGDAIFGNLAKPGLRETNQYNFSFT